MTAVRYETIPILVTKWNKYYQEKVLEKKKTKNKKKYKQEKETNIARSSVSTKERREEITFRPEPPLYTHTHTGIAFRSTYVSSKLIIQQS